MMQERTSGSWKSPARSGTMLLLILLPTLLSAQGLYTRIDSALSEPGKVKSLLLDCSKEQCTEAFQRIGELRELEDLELRSGAFSKAELSELIAQLRKIGGIQHLSLRRVSVDSIPEKLAALNELQTFALHHCSEVDQRSLVEILKKSPVKSLILEGDMQNGPPENISDWHSLEELYISRNSELDPERVIEEVKELEGLRILSLPLNGIGSIPDNIEKLEGLEHLDVRGNTLNDLPSEMEALQKLRELSLEGNFISDPIEVLQKAKDLELERLTLDHYSEEEIEQLKRMFPNAELEERSFDENAPTDSTFTEKEPQKDSGDPGKKNEKKAYGEFDVKEERPIALSIAYHKFADIMETKLLRADYDTTLFQERFNDTAYANNFRKLPARDYDFLNLYYHETTDEGQVVFDFRRDDFSPFGLTIVKMADYSNNVGNYNKEITAFSDMVWIHLGDLDRKRFKKKYVKDISYNDCRIHYEGNKGQFELVLKRMDGYDTLKATPAFPERLDAMKDARERAERSYQRYLRNLQRRRRRFNMDLRRNYSGYSRQLRRMKKNAWRDMKKNYMSEEEKEMSQEEWFRYFDRVVMNEEEALLNAEPKFRILERAMVIKGFQGERAPDRSRLPLSLGSNAENLRAIEQDSAFPINANVNFFNEVGQKLPVERIMLIYPEQQEYLVMEGEYGLEPRSTFMAPGIDAHVVVELRNERIGYINAEEIERIAHGAEGSYLELPVAFLDENLGSVGQLQKALGF